MNFTEIDQNPYAAPQASLTLPPRARAVFTDRYGFPWALVRQGLRNGAVAGLIASLAMLFVYLLPREHEPREAAARLLLICGVFTLGTSSLGLFWGLNHAIIRWVIQLWPTRHDDAIEA